MSRQSRRWPTTSPLALEKLEVRNLLAQVSDNLTIFQADFEDVHVAPGSWSFFSAVSGFTATSSNVEIQNQVPFVGASSQGRQHLELDGINGVAVDLKDGIDRGLQLRFDYSPRPGIPAEQNRIEIWWNHSLLASIAKSGAGLHDTNFASVSIELPAIRHSSASQLEFRSNSPFDLKGLGGLVDNVVVSRKPSSEIFGNGETHGEGSRSSTPFADQSGVGGYGEGDEGSGVQSFGDLGGGGDESGGDPGDPGDPPGEPPDPPEPPDPVEPKIQFTNATFDVSEFQESVRIVLSLDKQPTTTVSVTVRLAVGGTATPDVDFEFSDPKIVTLQGRDGSFVIPIELDNVSEDDETIFLRLSNPVNADLGAIPETVVTIRDSTLNLSVDSSNDGTIDSQDDEIEDDPDKPGKVILTNLLDHTANNVPDFADGIELFGNGGADRSQDFADAKLVLPDDDELDAAIVKFDYSDAEPWQVRFDESTGEYIPGSTAKMRIWTKQGSESRIADDVADGGDFITSGRHYQMSDIFGGSNTRETTFYVEGIYESEMAQALITVKVDPDGSGPLGFTLLDRVRMSVAHIQVVYTDVSGITGTANVKRIDRAVEPDGLTADWQEGVEDGSLLLVSVVVSGFLKQMADNNPEMYAVDFGQFDRQAGSYRSGLVADDGVYVRLDDNSFFSESRFTSADNALHSLAIPGIGEEFQGTGRYVADARFYRPPFEHARAGSDVEKYRDIAVQVSLDGIVETTGGKPFGLTLARPAVVTVHGINSDPGTWDAFVERSDPSGPPGSKFGFHIRHFRVDHSGRDENSSFRVDGPTKGNGELSSMYVKIPKMIDGVVESFHQGRIADLGYRLFARDGFVNRYLNVAMQKVDIVAHSYGGLLSRWYIEEAEGESGVPGSEFNDRRDVRRLITLGTPHKGSPFANIVTEIKKDGLFAHSLTDQGPLQMQTVLNRLQGWPFKIYTERPNGEAWHSYQVMSINSEILRRLNANAFHDDVSYGAIAGTRTIMYYLDIYRAFQAVSNVHGNSNDRYLWPWLKVFEPDDNDTDAIVPVWSAKLGSGLVYNAEIPVNHNELTGDPATMSVVEDWLDGYFQGGSLRNPLPLGSFVRANFEPGVPVSYRNAYVGSLFQEGKNTRAGVNRDAIVKVELNPADVLSPAYGVFNFGAVDPFDDDGLIEFGTAPDQVGAKSTALTGMIQWRHKDQLILRLASDESGFNGGDNILHDLGVLTRAQLNLKPEYLPGIGNDDWIPFRVTHAKIGRLQSQFLTGPTDEGGEEGWRQYVIYHLEIHGGGETEAPPKSGHTFAALPEFVLPPPVIAYDLDPTGLTLRISGAVTAVITAPDRRQFITIDIYDEDNDLLDPIDDLLVHGRMELTHADDVWTGLLVPYYGMITLGRDNDGNVNGTHGSSGEAQAQVYQYLRDDGPWADEVYSEAINVP